jgi:large subunit ribosomal protein L16
MEQPKRVKFRKMQKGRRRGAAHSGNTLSFGEFGLQAMESACITARQIEAARRTFTHHFRRGGKVWIRIFPDKPITKKPAETRMGSGKGAPDHWVAVVKRGRMMFELGDVSLETAKEAARLASNKLPLETKFVVRPIAVAAAEAEPGDGKETQGEN